MGSRYNKNIMKNLRGKNLTSSKQYNRGLLLQLIATGAADKRMELAGITRLTKMTISNIITEFMELGLVEESEMEFTESCGRNPVRLQIAKKAPKLLGLLVFRSRVEGVICDLSLNILHRECIRFDSLTADELVKNCKTVIDKLLFKESNILGIGISAIGPSDLNRGMILNPTRFYGIRNVPILELVRARYPYPVFFDHDNNGAALAEKLYGLAKKTEDFIFVGASDGIGSGIVSGGHLYHTSCGIASEIGHITIDRNGPVCSCGNRGCLEVYASTFAVLGRLRKATGLDLDFQQFCALEGNAAADQVFSEVMEEMAIVLTGVVNLLEPQMIILGHDCIDWKERDVKRLEMLINEHSMIRGIQSVSVKKSYFGKNALVLGAASIVADQIFSGKLLWE